MINYLTIEKEIETEIIEKRSRFIANLFYVSGIEEVEEKLQEIKRKYKEARHHCYAYVIEKEGSMLKKASDDGEPTGTAGIPILTVLEKNNLCNLLVVVTRYFGGILLGTGGLARAYSGVTIKAIEESELVQERKGIALKVELEYNGLEKFQYYCKKNEISIEKIEYLEKIICNIVIKKEEQLPIFMNGKENSFRLLKCEILGEKILREKRK